MSTSTCVNERVCARARQHACACVRVRVTSACTEEFQVSRAVHGTSCFLQVRQTLGRCDSPLAQGRPFASSRCLSQKHLLLEAFLERPAPSFVSPIKIPWGPLPQLRDHTFTLPASSLFCGPCCVPSAQHGPCTWDTLGQERICGYVQASSTCHILGLGALPALRR